MKPLITKQHIVKLSNCLKFCDLWTIGDMLVKQKYKTLRVVNLFISMPNAHIKIT